MKYGYLYWANSHYPRAKRCVLNTGDPVQSLAVMNLYREMGISDNDIIPVNRYDTTKYKNDEMILIFNGNHAEYFSRILSVELFPYSKNIIPVFFSFHTRLFSISEDEIKFLRNHQPIGCRDAYTYEFMARHGIEAYITGCLSLTLPLRNKTERQNKVFLIDCPKELHEFIPAKIRDGAVTMSQIIKIDSASGGSGLTNEETERFHTAAYEQLYRIRDDAKLVITSRLHVATACLAMGVPVICAKKIFDVRFFIKRFLPLYTPDIWDNIDWDPAPPDIEHEKRLIKECFFSAVRAAAAKFYINKTYAGVDYSDLAIHNLSGIFSKIPLPPVFRYAIWGCHTPEIYNFHNELKVFFPNSILVNMIDSFVEGTMFGVDIIRPDKIELLPKDVIVFVLPPSLQNLAKERLHAAGRSFVLYEKSNITLHNI